MARARKLQRSDEPTMAARDPYRQPSTTPTDTPRTAVYNPALGAGTLGAAVALAGTLALAFHSRDHSPSVASCTTAQSEGRCLILDAGQATASPIPCDQAIVQLDDLLRPRGVFLPPATHARTTITPVPRRIVPAEHHTVGIPPRIVTPRSRRSDILAPTHPLNPNGTITATAAVFEPTLPTSASDDEVAAAWPRLNPRPDGTVAPADARGLFAACLLAPVAEREARTVTIALFARDDRPSLFAAAFVLLAALLWTLRRRTVITVDPARSRLEVHEHRWLRHHATHHYPLAELVNVRVATGAAGPFVASRLELVGRSSALHPLVDAFTPFTRGHHERLASAIRRMLQLPAVIVLDASRASKSSVPAVSGD